MVSASFYEFVQAKGEYSILSRIPVETVDGFVVNQHTVFSDIGSLLLRHGTVVIRLFRVFTAVNG